MGAARRSYRRASVRVPGPSFRLPFSKRDGARARVMNHCQEMRAAANASLPCLHPSLPPSVPPIRTLKLALQNSERASERGHADRHPSSPSPPAFPLPLFVLFLVGTFVGTWKLVPACRSYIISDAGCILGFRQEIFPRKSSSFHISLSLCSLSLHQMSGLVSKLSQRPHVNTEES